MSVIVAKGSQITRCGNNTSTSNQMYSFGVGKRFNKVKALSQSFYDLPSSININKVGNSHNMGIGDRNSFCKNFNKKENLPKTYYYEESAFIKKAGSVTSFGKPPTTNSNKIRKDTSCISTFDTITHNANKNNPELTNNNISNNNKKSIINAPSLKGKQKTYFDIKPNNVPGPGQYSLQQQSFSNKQTSSSNFSKTTHQRFKDNIKNDTPGPQYNPDNKNISGILNKTKKRQIHRNLSAKIIREPNKNERLNFKKDSDNCNFFI